jgi:UDP-N-acetylglucosamine 2-epimerase (non-hydrolysing)
MSEPLIVHVTGARPNFPKAAPVIAALAKREVRQLLVHTGQHYDDAMSKVFFDELSLPMPDVNLGVGSGTHAEQTAAVMIGVEKLLMEHKPDLVMVYGDINSTVATALVCAKLQIPCAHVEAGLRSFDDSMPEEINRRLTDQISTLLFATSADAIEHLTREGIAREKIHFVGNPMIDTLISALPRLDSEKAANELGVEHGKYAVVTMHRPSNVDDPVMLERATALLHSIADEIDVIFPIHPRGRDRFVAAGLDQHPRIHITGPLAYVQFISAVRGSRFVMTDSGGVQEETTVLGIPCLTLRPNTERPVTITHGTNRLVDLDSALAAVREVVATPLAETWPTPELWDGHAGERIAAVTIDWLARR